MIKYYGHTQLVRRLKRLESIREKLMRNYHLQPGEENLCLVTRYTNELEMEVRTVTHPKENEVLLRVGSCCISTYDFDYLMRYRGKDQSFDKNLVLGTLGTGIVLEKGSGVEGMFNLGDHVAIEPGINCQKCIYCISGKTNLCPHIRYLGTGGLDGILCRFINHPAIFTQKLPEGVSLDLGTLTTKIAGCIHGYRRSGITNESRILIMGTSLIGLLAIMIFKHLGAGTIFVADNFAETNNYKLKMARIAGADYVIKLSSLYSPEYPEYLKQIINSIESGEPDIVVDTIGTASSLENSYNLIKSGGRIVLMNRMTRPIETKFFNTTLREIDIVGAYSYTHTSFVEAVTLLSNESIPFKKILPIRIPLERALDAFSHGRATGGENLFMLVNSYVEKDETTKSYESSEEKTASIPDLTPVSEIPEPKIHTESSTEEMKPTISTESSKTTASEREIGLGKKTDTSDEGHQEVTSTSPIDEKMKEETKKHRIYEVNLRPESTASEREKTDTSDEHNKEVTSKSPIDDKMKGETKKHRIYEVNLRPESTASEREKTDEHNKEVTSTSPIDEKMKGETKKHRIYEVNLRPESTASEREKTDKSDEHNKEVTSTSPIDEKMKEETKKHRIYEVNLRPESTSSETEKVTSKKQIDTLDKHEKEKVSSTSPTDEKKKDETKKERIYEVIIQPKSAAENENKQRPEGIAEKNETEQDFSSNKKYEKQNTDNNNEIKNDKNNKKK